MGPSIRRSLSEGFRAANRSWAGIGFFTGVLLLVTVVSLMAIAASNPPTPPLPGEEGPTAAVPVAPTPVAVEPPATTPAEERAPAVANSEVNLFNQLETTQPPAAPTDATQPVASAPAQATTVPPDAGAQLAEQERAFREWFGRAWPLMFLVLVVLLVVNAWLSGGQIGYLAARVSHQPAKLSLFWEEGTRAFGRLLGAWILLIVVGILVTVLVGSLLTLLPPVIGVVFSVLTRLVFMAASAWISLWFIAVVVDRVGPIAGLKTSLRVTKGRRLKTAGLGLLIGLIFIGLWLVFALIMLLSNAIGGVVAATLFVTGSLAGSIASLYLGFAALAAYIRCYQDMKGQVAASPSA